MIFQRTRRVVLNVTAPLLMVVGGVQAAEESAQRAPSYITSALLLPAYVHYIDMMPGPGAPPEPGSVPALYRLVNRSGTPVTLALISHCGEQKDVQFTLRDAGNQVLWRYIATNDLMGCPDTLVPTELADGGALNAVVDVPLAPNGVTLEAGEYRLEAHVDGEPQYGGYAPLRIEYAY